jgi:hypothetical protein
MATTTKIVRGRYWDGNVNTDAANTIAHKVNDITTGAANIYAVAITKSGQELTALVVYN